MTNRVCALVAVDRSILSHRPVEFVQSLQFDGESQLLVLSVAEPVPGTHHCL
jgi:hypothetical protein